ncbi:hypothetical protein BG015_004415 [Linnemannia schmuckeri]|uniref:CCD97-like C-terminal domain-containing protein n=1 Tax=Linnemannia schmuckeri TaxID=64567 RepID=A0A9P5S4C1_9FUNG|nr:hypothetical protein BG015_004415 [Linnemannia schmuckeri]
MALSQESIAAILAYLDPYLDTLETGFPTSTRPNEPLLSKDLKRAKIEATLQKDPAIFLAKWGSVILYPRPQTKPATGEESNGVNSTSHKVGSLTSAKNILDLFNPLAVDYEVRHHLTRLYQQLQQLMEHANFKASRQQRQSQRQPSGLNNADNITTASSSVHNRSHGYNPTSTTNYMEIDPNLSAQQTNSDNRDIPEEDRKPNPGQNDLFTRSTLSQNTRRNRRLNYLLRHLAPPDGSESPGVAGVASSTNSASSASRAKNPSTGASSSSSSSAGASQSKSSRDTRNPTLASILSISGSMSNLSFSESTYFSDAEMEARAPDLYRQYIGRFMDQDDDRDSQGEEEEEEDDQGEVTGAEDADDEREDTDTRQSSASPEPFGKDVGLVDRILWNIDHPTRKQQKKQLQQELESRRAAQERNAGEGSSSHDIAKSLHHQQRSTASHDRTASAVAPAVSESEFEEEFDTESDVDDADMEDSAQSQEKADDQDMEVEKDDRKGPLKNVADDQLLAATSVTPPIPPSPVPGVVSSTFASAAMTLEQPESRARFAALESGNGLGSSEDEAPELDQATKERKEDQESLRQEFVLLMKQRFLDGLDSQFDYSLVDFDEDLDDLEQEDHDVEDRYFDAEDEDGDDEDDDGGILDGQLSSKRQVGRAPGSGHSRKMNYDERVQAWENSAQNGSGDYDY